MILNFETDSLLYAKQLKNLITYSFFLEISFNIKNIPSSIRLSQGNIFCFILEKCLPILMEQQLKVNHHETIYMITAITTKITTLNR